MKCSISPEALRELLPLAPPRLKPRIAQALHNGPLARRLLRPVSVLAVLALAAVLIPGTLFAVEQAVYPPSGLTIKAVAPLPGITTVRGGTAVKIVVIATFPDNTTQDVTAASTFTVINTPATPPIGKLSGQGTGWVAYNSKWRENDVVTIQATYQSMTTTYTITVVP